MKLEFDIHTHTLASGHAYSTLTENVKRACELGLKAIGISDHAPEMPGSASTLYFYNVPVIPKEIDGVEILMGCELNIMDTDGTVDLAEGLIKRLAYTIASFHPTCIDPMDKESSTLAMINTIRNPLVNIIGHPGDTRYPLDYIAVVNAAIEHNTLLEINENTLNPFAPRTPDMEVLKGIVSECRKRDYPLIMGSDAHFHTAVGNMPNATRLLKELDFPDELIINYSYDRLKEFLKK